MEWIDLGPVCLRYELAGQGPPLVLLHEMGGTLESWDALVERLAPEHRILRFDARGAGLSELPPDPITMEGLGADTVALLDALQVHEKVVVVGTAVGGATALHVAATYPERVAGVLATSPAIGVPADRREPLLVRAAQIETRGVRPDIAASLDRDYPAAVRGDAARFERTRGQRIAVNRAGMAATMRMLADLDMRATLARLTVPCRLLAGEYDGSRPPANVAETAALIPHASLRVVPAGHFMAAQVPDLLADEIRGFVAGLS